MVWTETALRLTSQSCPSGWPRWHATILSASSTTRYVTAIPLGLSAIKRAASLGTRQQLELARVFVDAKIANALALRLNIQSLANSDDTHRKECCFATRTRVSMK